ncbi:hydrogenase expression/formation protein HypE [Butyrivibrio proteoclasticus]|uniref:Hydrogenase expression/formation protein HypE n=1 Tax=Butyrivibrio proteoclasticus TaxID=43305 RepID=A0A1I5QL55_9FIRM|nr:hydrogenase expression/formation protein HypE [Butyrivibrio proteoclasticus]SFP47038.1 hydrogenase expression/formation protein HypE [Butyrivibrio proteoclasticus]
MKITMAHGSGGESTSALIRDIFAKHFHNEILDKLEDSAVVKGCGRLAVTTDSFVVTPIEFPGGDIGRLSVCGTVNDLLMSGAKPMYLTCGCILEEGLDMDVLDRVISSMANTANEAGIKIITGDTKVIENKGGEPGLIINTSGVGFISDSLDVPGPFKLQNGDKIIISGNLGDHHAAILGSRMGIQNNIKSDAAPLVEMVKGLLDNNVEVHAMRDVTRGGLGTVLNEFCESSKCSIDLFEDRMPVSPAVKDFCGLLGLDPMYMGNEGKMVLSVAANDVEKALSIIKKSKYGENACVIGEVRKIKGSADKNNVVLNTKIGGKRIIGLMYGEGLPRIC